MTDQLRKSYLGTLPRKGVPLYMAVILYGSFALYLLTIGYAWFYLHTWYNIITKLAGITAIAAFAAVLFKTRSDILQSHFERLDRARKQASRLVTTVYQKIKRDMAAKSYPIGEIVDNMEAYRIQDIFAHLHVDCEAARVDMSQIVNAALRAYLETLSKSEEIGNDQRERIMVSLRSLGAVKAEQPTKRDSSLRSE
jgi:hypothetical protein